MCANLDRTQASAHYGCYFGKVETLEPVKLDYLALARRELQNRSRQGEASLYLGYSYRCYCWLGA